MRDSDRLPTVLFAEDDPDDVVLIERAIARCGRAVAMQVVQNGRDALSLLMPPAIPPDLTFLDINLPLVSGLDVLRSVRAARHARPPVIVVMTTSTAPRDRDHAVALGCNDFHVKPISFGSFIEIIVETLDRWLGPHVAEPGRKNERAMLDARPSNFRDQP